MLLRSFKLPVEHLSASALAQFLTCAEQYRLERIVKIPRRRFVDGFVGSVHHDTIAANLAQKIETKKDQNLEQMNQIFTYLWHEQIEKEEPVWTDHPERVEKLGRKMLETFHTHISPTISPIAVEQRFEETVPGLPVPVIGYIDAEETETIQEFKSAKQKVSSPKPSWKLQGSIYQLFVRKPLYFTVTTKQATPVNWSWSNAPDLVQQPGDPDVTVRILQQAVECLNDYW